MEGLGIYPVRTKVDPPSQLGTVERYFGYEQREYAMIPTSKTVKDPVCLMEIDPDEAVEREDYQNRQYYFCNAVCHRAFQLDPERYAKQTM